MTTNGDSKRLTRAQRCARRRKQKQKLFGARSKVEGAENTIPLLSPRLSPRRQDKSPPVCPKVDKHPRVDTPYPEVTHRPETPATARPTCLRSAFAAAATPSTTTNAAQTDAILPSLGATEHPDEALPTTRQVVFADHDVVVDESSSLPEAMPEPIVGVPASQGTDVELLAIFKLMNDLEWSDLD